MSDAQKKQVFHQAVDELADVPKITNFVLGKYARTITPDQRARFTPVFRTYAEGVYQSRIDDYRGEQLKVTGSVIRKPGDVIVNTVISGGQITTPLPVSWRVLGGGASWKVVDVQFKGIWLAITQQQDFVSTIDNAGGNIDVLINQLQKGGSRALLAASAKRGRGKNVRGYGLARTMGRDGHGRRRARPGGGHVHDLFAERGRRPQQAAAITRSAPSSARPGPWRPARPSASPASRSARSRRSRLSPRPILAVAKLSIDPTGQAAVRLDRQDHQRQPAGRRPHLDRARRGDGRPQAGRRDRQHARRGRHLRPDRLGDPPTRRRQRRGDASARPGGESRHPTRRELLT
jgi:phospholipid transport system substrate-binding protein